MEIELVALGLEDLVLSKAQRALGGRAVEVLLSPRKRRGRRKALPTLSMLRSSYT